MSNSKIRFAGTFTLILSLFLPFQFSYAGSKAEKLYQDARGKYQKLSLVSPTRSNRNRFVKCIHLFEHIATRYPNSSKADDSLFSAGNLYTRLYNGIKFKSDKKSAIESYRTIISKYPNSRLADDSQYKIGEIYQNDHQRSLAKKAYKKVVYQFPNGDMAQKARDRLSGFQSSGKTQNRAVKTSPGKASQKKPILQRIRHWSSSNYTRVVLDLEGMTPFTSRETEKPRRLTLQLYDTFVEPTLPKKIRIKDGVVQLIRVDRDKQGRVKIRIDFDQGGDHKVFIMKDPYRIVVDFHKNQVRSKETVPKKVKTTPEKNVPDKSKGPLFNVRTIVIDPGHGGKDPGALGPGGTKEKTVTLGIAKKLKEELKKSLRCKVILTRSDDRYLDLAERTAIANIADADLFISIHANASKNRRTHGTETFFLSPARSRGEQETAARENMIAKASMDEIENDLAYILADMQGTDNINHSVQLAGKVQKAIIRGTRRQHPKAKDLGVKQAMFYVLLEAKMPSVLVETAFISNPSEEKKLTSSKYQWAMARSISDGVKSYIQENKLAYRTN